MAYILDNSRNDVGNYVVPVGTPNIITSYDKAQVIDNFIIGQNSTKYVFPSTKSPSPNYTLKDPGTGILEWTALTSGGGGSGDITNGGQSGAISIGSTDNTMSFINSSGPQIQILQDGTIYLGNPSNPNNIIITGGIDYSFKQITGPITNYDLTNNDYMIEVINATVNTITLPTAIGNGGRTYIITSGSTNTNLTIVPQSGQTIDGSSSYRLKYINTHLRIVSNSIGSWYRI